MVVVRDHMENAPWWELSLISGLLFGSLMGVVFASQSTHHLSAGVVGGLIAGVVYGAVVGPFTASQRKRTNDVLGPIAVPQRRAARRAAIRGPVPTDPQTREAAARFASFQLDHLYRTRWVGLIVLAAMVILSAVNIIFLTAWWSAGVLLFGGLLTLLLVWPRHLRRRLARLSAPAASRAAAKPGPRP